MITAGTPLLCPALPALLVNGTDIRDKAIEEQWDQPCREIPHAVGLTEDDDEITAGVGDEPTVSDDADGVGDGDGDGQQEGGDEDEGTVQHSNEEDK